MSSLRITVLVIATLSFAQAGLAQTVLFEFHGAAVGDSFGRSVANAGDINLDGFDDILIGSPGSDVFALDAGLVQVFSGRNGQVLLTIPGVQAGALLGGAVSSAGDINGDGRKDLLVGATSDTHCPSTVYGGGYARVFSGLDGTLLQSPLANFASQDPKRRFGFAVSGVGDIDSDGFADYIVGAPAHTWDCTFNVGFGSVWVFSGRTGAIKYSFVTIAEQSRGYSVCGVDDINGDGVPDMIYGDPDYTGETDFFGRVSVRSGADGSEVHEFVGHTSAQNFDRMGRVVGAPGDIDADGFPDILACEGELNSPLDRRWTRAFSGATGSVLLLINETYSSISGAGDLDGDSNADFALGHANNFVEWRSGASGDLLHQVQGTTAGDGFGISIARIGDLNGDGIDELVVGAPQDQNGGKGYVRVLSGASCGAQTYCVTSPNSVGPGALISYSGSVELTQNNMVLQVTGAPPSNAGVFFFGPSQTQAPLGNGFLCVGAPLERLPAIFLDASGASSMPLDFTAPSSPLQMITSGTTWNFQFWYRDPLVGAGNNLSDALEAHFCL